jgi:putative SOS response-associated peptidase YedK
MCGRYAFTLPHEAMIRLFRVPWFAPYPPRYNIAPTQPILAVRASPNGREAFLVRWGLVPNWVKDPRDFPLVINARAETLLEKPAFRGAIRHHRCLIPASGYYEWQKTSSGKVPHYITRADGEPMALAGLYETWEGPDGNIIDTAAIVTVAASPDMAHLHDRTPAMLEPDLWDAWLDTSQHLAGVHDAVGVERGLIARIMSSATGSFTCFSSSVLSWPMPCSAETEPPRSSTTS